MKKQNKWLLWLTLVTLPFLFSGVILSVVNASERIPTVVTITPESSGIVAGNSIGLTRPEHSHNNALLEKRVKRSL